MELYPTQLYRTAAAIGIIMYYAVYLDCYNRGSMYRPTARCDGRYIRDCWC